MQKSVLSRDFYSFATLFTSLFIGASIVQGIAFITLRSKVLTLGSFYPWMLVCAFISMVASLTLLQYFRHKSYRAVFILGAIAMIANLWQYALVYHIMMYRGLQKIYISSSIAGLSIGILYGLSLVFSKASEKPWLKWSGVLSVILGPVLIAITLWSINSQDVPTKMLLENVYYGVSMLGILVPVMFLLNLRNESKLLTDTGEKTPPVVWRELAKVLAIMGLLFFGAMFAGESFRTGSHTAYIPTPSEKKQAEAFGARNYVNGQGDTLRYRLITPVDYDSTKQYPMIVCLHHGGAHGTDNMRQLAAEPAPFLSSDANRKKYPAFIFMPHCPEGYGFGGIEGYPTIDTLVFKAMASVEQQYRIDPKRRYVIGISGGGYGSWHFISTHPELFAAAIPICGGGDAKYGKTLVDMPIWAFHGARDHLAPVSGTREIIDAIEKAGGKPKYSEFAYAGHDIWNDVKNAPGLLEWLFAQKRDD